MVPALACALQATQKVDHLQRSPTVEASGSIEGDDEIQRFADALAVPRLAQSTRFTVKTLGAAEPPQPNKTATASYVSLSY
jgi:hypothetical protein